MRLARFVSKLMDNSLEESPPVKLKRFDGSMPKPAKAGLNVCDRPDTDVAEGAGVKVKVVLAGVAAAAPCWKMATKSSDVAVREEPCNPRQQ